MHDDGREGDTQAGDDIFTVVLPDELQRHRRLVRYRITATDTLDSSITAPYADDPQPNFTYFVYDGIPAWTGADRPGVTPPITYGTEVMRSLPAYHLIAQESDVIDSQYNQRFMNRRFNGTLVYDGIVYDHIEFRIRGQNSTYVTGKNKWILFFTRGHEFRARDDDGNAWRVPVRKLSFGTAASPWARPNRGLAGMDEALAFKFFNLAGVAAPNISAFQLRIIDNQLEADPESQYNGDLWGLYLAFEDPSGSFLEQHGLPDGSLFRMQGGTGELKHQGLGLPSNRSDLRAFTSARTGYNKTNPPQPIEWWRQNVDLEVYYSYRAVIEAINHSDLRDQENTLMYFNAETKKWSQHPWDLDLLYEEFQRWGPFGVQNMSKLEQFRLALQHEEILLEFQARLREVQDLLFNPEQSQHAVEEYARYVEPFAAIDRAMWDYHPRTSSIHKGFFYRSPAPYHGGAQCCIRRELTSPDFEGMINWVKEFIGPTGYGGRLLAQHHADQAIPHTPTISYTGVPGFAIDRLRFTTTPFSDPQGNDTFRALQWRVAEVTDRAAPAFAADVPVHYEITPIWQSEPIVSFSDSIELDAGSLQVGHAYRARVRVQDSSGRWSHWSEPIQFIPIRSETLDQSALRVSEIHYHPAPPSTSEIAAGFDDPDDFEFIEVTNAGNRSLDLTGVEFVMSTFPAGEQGVAFAFSDSAVTVLRPGESVVVVEDEAAFRLRYGTSIRLAGEWNGGLSNGNETITLTASGQTLVQFTYRDDWHPATDGKGSSLEAVDFMNPDASILSTSAGWRSSARIHGTPGVAGSVPGDSNRDRVFDSRDLVLVFTAAEFEDSVAGNSTWEEGDWTGDGDFTTADLVYAFQNGNYVSAARSDSQARRLNPAAVSAVFRFESEMGSSGLRW
jgi:hypothetical protein